MDKPLEQLLLRVQQYPRESQERQQALIELIEQILRSRRICRPAKGQLLSSIHLDIFQAVQQKLQQEIDQSIEYYNPQRTLARSWTNLQRDKVFKQVLDSDRLTQLALEVQQQKPQTKEWHYALRELLDAIWLSGKLSHQSQTSTGIYEDAVTRTLFWVCQNINAYNPKKGKFTAWVNYRLDMIIREIQQELKDPFIQSIEGKIIRRKYQRNNLIKKTKEKDIKFWLSLKLKGLLPATPSVIEFTLFLTVSLMLSRLIAQNPNLGNSLLFELSKISLYSLARLPTKANHSIIETIAQPEEKPFLSETLREYIENDPAKLFQKHIKEHPQATFQTIALARLNGKTWREMSESFGVGIPALNNFFQRSLRQLAPEIRKSIQSHS